MPLGRRASYIFLCTTPFIVMLVEGPRSLRVPIAYQSIGIVLFIAIAGAIWTLGGRAIRAGTL